MKQQLLYMYILRFLKMDLSAISKNTPVYL